MNDKILKIKNSGFVKTLKTVLSSKYYPFILAVFTLLCYYLGWDVALIWVLGISGTLMFTLLDDVSPVISVFLLMSVCISLKNTPSPSMGNSDYYFRTANLVQISIVISLFIASALFRTVYPVYKKKFSFCPVFFGLCALFVALFVNGLFSEDYVPKNLLFGLIIGSALLVIFSAIRNNVKPDGDIYENIALAFTALSAVLLIELIVAYATTENLFVDGTIIRDRLIFGWGVYNNFSVLLLTCLPATVYLATRHKLGYLFTLYSLAVFTGVFLSCSRQAMVGGIIIYPVCVVILFLKGKYRLINTVIYSIVAVVCIVLAVIYCETVINFFKVIFQNVLIDGELNASGRNLIWGEAIKNFVSAPVFGVGFYTEFSYTSHSGLGFMPQMCHNTILELLSACGLAGLTVYAVHRAQTLVSFFRNVTVERSFIMLSITAIIILSLFDNHIFNIFPTIIYSSLLGVMVSDEMKKQKN